MRVWAPTAEGTSSIQLEKLCALLHCAVKRKGKQNLKERKKFTGRDDH